MEKFCCADEAERRQKERERERATLDRAQSHMSS